MTDAIERLRKIDGLKLTPYIPHVPTGKQAAFLMCDTREALYGGAAGGGKSDGLLMGALQYVDVPHFRALLLRRTFSALILPEALMHRAREWLVNTDAKWRDSEKTWYFPNGATLTFGFLQYDKDCDLYQGAAFQYVGFDELTQFNEYQYRYLFSRLRRTLCPDHREGFNEACTTCQETAQLGHVPLRIRAASNPGNVGHGWVKQRFIVEGPTQGRPFIPAGLADNPYLDADEYRKSLMNLDAVTRAQLLNGDWSARVSGGMFKREWFEIVDEYPRTATVVRYWDLAATAPKANTDPDYTCGVKMAKTSDGVYYICDVKRGRMSPLSVESLVSQTAAIDGKATSIYMEQEGGSGGINSIDNYRRNVLAGYAFYPDKVMGDKATRARPLSSQVEAGNVKLVKGPWIGEFLDELEIFPEGGHDDQVDAASGAFGMLNGSTFNDWERAAAAIIQRRNENG